nr:uncharacterized protein CTRU02_15555 [Colletotrichum truncatum]KAF6780934.1 hypothetical protein CTRU02_15555 [Colletotrichum truncatum]
MSARNEPVVTPAPAPAPAPAPRPLTRLSPIYEISEADAAHPLSSFPLTKQPSLGLSNTWVHENVTTRRQSRQKRKRTDSPDRQVKTVIGAMQLQRHGHNTIDAVNVNKDISKSAVNNARRLDYLQTIWPGGEIIPPRFRDPHSKHTPSWHVTNEMYKITRLFVNAGLPLESMWDNTAPEDGTGPRGVIPRHIADTTVTYITGKAARKAYEELKKSCRLKVAPVQADPAGHTDAKQPEGSPTSSLANVHHIQPFRAASVDDKLSRQEEIGDDQPQDECDMLFSSDGGPDDEIDGNYAEYSPSVGSDAGGNTDSDIEDGRRVVSDGDVLDASFPLLAPLAKSVAGSNFEIPDNDLPPIASPLFEPKQEMLPDLLDIQPSKYQQDLAKATVLTAEDKRKSSITRQQPNNLLFTTQFSNDQHWAVAHLERSAATICFYDSMRSPRRSSIVRSALEAWARENALVGTDQVFKFKTKDCPQQKDGINCGVFAIEAILRLASGREWPVTIDPSRCRQEYINTLVLHEPLKPAEAPASKSEIPQQAQPSSAILPRGAAFETESAIDAAADSEKRSTAQNPQELETRLGENVTSPPTMWSQSELKAAAAHALPLQLVQFLSSHEAIMSERLSQLYDTSSRLESEETEILEALGRVAAIRKRLEEIQAQLDSLRKEREATEEELAGLQHHDTEHRRLLNAMTTKLPAGFSQDVRTITEQHLSEVGRRLTGINHTITEVTSSLIQSQTELDQAVEKEARLEKVRKERREISASIAWLSCIANAPKASSC